MQPQGRIACGYVDEGIGVVGSEERMSSVEAV